MLVTYNKLVELGNNFGRINFKGWTIADINECLIEEYGKEEIAKATDKELHEMITDGIHEWNCQNEYAEIMQDYARECGWGF